MSCCSSSYEQVFGERQARKDARKYRRKGLHAPARWLVDAVVAEGVDGATVLEVGGGVGALQLELLKAGAARTVNVELSSSYEAEAAELVREAGAEGRVERILGDFVESGPLPEADVVVLHRVVCCYPDYEGLLGEAARHARRIVVFSHPPRNAVSRGLLAGVNLFLRLSGRDFRGFAHPPAALVATVRRHGLESVAERRHGIWRAVALARVS